MITSREAERTRGGIEMAGGILSMIGGGALALAIGVVEAVKFSEARAYSAITHLNLVPELEPITVPALAVSVGVVSTGAVLYSVGKAHRNPAEISVVPA